MRVKKQKQLRRHVRFYKTCFGFREPYKVLCDGTFVHYNLTNKLGALQDSLPTLLGAAAKPFVTRCVIAELKKLGEAYSGTALAARRLDLAKCQHEPFLPAGECVAAMVGSHNTEHYFVATQDIELRKQLRKVHGGALIYARNTMLVLEPPSEKQLQYAKLSQVERNCLTEREKHLLKIREEKHSVQDGIEVKQGGGDEGSAVPGSLDKHRKKKNDALGVKDRPTFKRNRVKGPNPLSCKKKQTKVEKSKSTEKKEVAQGDGGQAKARRRSRQHKLEERPGQMWVTSWLQHKLELT